MYLHITAVGHKEWRVNRKTIGDKIGFKMWTKNAASATSDARPTKPGPESSASKSRGTSRKPALGAFVAALILCFGGASTASAAPISLLLSQSAAFGILGHSCGGIQEQAYATGFDATSGLPTGDVYIQTRCGGSGRGGGYHPTTYSAWVGVTWDYTGNAVSWAQLTTAPTVNSTFTATDAYGDQVYNTGTAAFLVVPTPAAPTGVTAVQSGDQFQVSWTPKGANPAAVTSSTLTATPVGSTAPVLTTTVSGSAATGLVGPLQPLTMYQITVATTTIGGTGLASAPISVKTVAATVAPSAPTGVTVVWASLSPSGTTDTLIITWKASVPGNSPVDQYQVGIRGSDAAGTFTQKVSGTTLTASFTVNFVPNWTVAVRAHNAVGWSPWSTHVSVGGL